MRRSRAAVRRIGASACLVVGGTIAGSRPRGRLSASARLSGRGSLLGRVAGLRRRLCMASLAVSGLVGIGES